MSEKLKAFQQALEAAASSAQLASRSTVAKPAANSNAKMPDYTSQQANINEQFSQLEGVFYNLISKGPDGVLGVATKDKQEALKFLHEVKMLQIRIADDVKPAPVKPAIVFRIGDAERDDTIRKLETAFANGNIRQDEYDERSSKALAAESQNQLDVLTQDLPASTVMRPIDNANRTLAIAEATERNALIRHHSANRMYAFSVIVLSLNMILTVLSVAGIIR
jgi:hypothetical protein